ncbi:hypothetical protein CMEL01_04421, partial [Colletotrichum melonis]
QAPEPPSLPLPYHTTGLRSALPRSGQPGARWGSPPAVQPLPRCPAPLRGHECWIMRLRECGKETTRCRLQNKLTAWHSIPHLPLSLFNLIEIILHVPLADYPQSTSSSVPRRNMCAQVSSARHPLPCPTASSFHLPQDLPLRFCCASPTKSTGCSPWDFGLCESRKGHVRIVAKTQVPSIFRRATAKEIDFC